MCSVQRWRTQRRRQHARVDNYDSVVVCDIHLRLFFPEHVRSPMRDASFTCDYGNAVCCRLIGCFRLETIVLFSLPLHIPIWIMLTLALSNCFIIEKKKYT